MSETTIKTAGHFSSDTSHVASIAESRVGEASTLADAGDAGTGQRQTISVGRADAASRHLSQDDPSRPSADPARSDDRFIPLAARQDTVGQAATTGPHQATRVIGRVVDTKGHVVVVRNGVAITLNDGDVLRKGDVVQTDRDGGASLIFKDGSVFQLGHDSRLALSDFSY